VLCWEQKEKERKKYPFPMPTGGRHVLGANMLPFRRIGNGRLPCPTLGDVDVFGMELDFCDFPLSTHIPSISMSLHP
jgi:hypothetical protein